MTQHPRERFRRIIEAWKARNEGRATPAAMYAPVKRAEADKTAGPAASLPGSSDDDLEQAGGMPPAQPVQTSPESTSQPPPLAAQRPSVSVVPRTPSDVISRQQSPDDSELSEPPVAEDVEGAMPPSVGIEIPPVEFTTNLDKLKTPADARRFLERLRTKTNQVVQDYSDGVINQRQFQAVYSHYQRQRLAVEKALIEMPGSGAWRAAAVEGHTSFLRQQHAAQVLGYAIYETATRNRLTDVGDLNVDEDVLTSIFESLSADGEELFGAGMQHREMEDGRWLCWMPGRYTALLVIFSTEPAAMQFQMVEDLHRDFELVNEMDLSSGDIGELASTFANLWAFDQGPLEP